MTARATAASRTTRSALPQRAGPEPAAPMPPPNPRPVDDAKVRRVELVISTVLRLGVVTSLALLVAGLTLDLAEHPAVRSSAALGQRLFTRQAGYPHSLTGVFSGLAHGDPVALMALGLVVLIATPVVRVTVSIFTFAYQRDPIFVAITSFVLAVLIGSFALGKVGG